jgi:putative transposase
MQDSRKTLKALQHEHNHHRPRSSLSHLTPSELLKKGQINN